MLSEEKKKKRKKTPYRWVKVKRQKVMYQANNKQKKAWVATLYIIQSRLQNNEHYLG